MKKSYLIYLLVSLLFFIKPIKTFFHTILADSVYIPVLKAEKFVEELTFMRSQYEKLNELLLLSMGELSEEKRKRLYEIWKNGLDTTYILARALYFDPFGKVQKITLDKGKNSGVRYGLPVVYRGNLVGKVYYTTDRLSFVMSLYNENFRVGVADQRSGVLGVLAGGSTPHLLYVPKWADVREGDTLITSGIGIIKGGIPAGVVDEVKNSSEDQFFFRIKVRPFWDFSSTGIFGIVK